MQVVKMSRSSSLIHLRDLSKVFIWAGIFVVGLAVSGAQAAVVTVYQQADGVLDTLSPTLGGGVAQWTTDAGALGTIGTETFGTAVANPPSTSASVAFGTITFGSSPGNSGSPALLGNISGGLYNDRADAAVGVDPQFNFSGLGVMAFGGDWNLGPNAPGTGIKLHITFMDNSTQDLTQEILNPGAGAGFVGFFGIVSDMAIKSIRLDEATAQQFGQAFETFNFDNAQFVSAVPIPAALPLFLSAIAALGFLGRRRIMGASA
jgi:hypothetical protein